MAESTVTSDKVIKGLEEQGVKLTNKNKTFIIKQIYDAVVTSYAEGKRVTAGGCDCGQMSCPECHG
jgi:hypothetical protein